MTFTIDTLKRLKIEYVAAKNKKQEIFVFDGHELLTDYAKYLIQYLETQLKICYN